MRLVARLDWLGERSKPYYGQVVLVSLILCAWPLCWYFLTHIATPAHAGERGPPATIFFSLPDNLGADPRLAYLAGAGFAVGSLLWLRLAWLPWSGWLTAFSFTAVVGLYLENACQCTHVAHLTCMLLVLYALWHHLYAADIRQALAAGQFWTTPLYPRWVYSGSVFYVGTFYGFSGLGKLWHSGIGWANGTSLQLWTHLFGDADSLCGKLILADRHGAAAMQAVTLLGETAALLAIVVPVIRPWVGLALLGFHGAAIAVFGWGFHANALVIALVFLPFYRWIPAWMENAGPGAALTSARAEFYRSPR